MDEPLGRKESKIQDDGIPHGCMGNLLHFLDFNQRFHVRKMLAHNKRNVGKNAERTRSPMVKQHVSTAEGNSFTDRGENIQVEDKGRITRNNSDKVLRRSLYSKRRHGDLNQIAPLTSHLLRTVSIHHLDSNDYVDDEAHSNENLTVVPSSYERSQSKPHGGQTKLNKIPDNLLEKHTLLRDKLINTKEASSKKKGTDAKELEHEAACHQSKELMEMMLLVNSNRDLLLKILKDPSSVASFLETQSTPSGDRVLDKLGSFPITSLPCSQRDEMQKSVSLVYGENLRVGTSSKMIPNFNENTFQLPNKLSSPFELKDQRESQWDNRTALSRFKIIKRSIKDLVKDNTKEGRRISMDGVLHRVPYGSKLSKDAKREKQGLLDTSNSRSKSIRRSHSLNESLDKYSRLLESISSVESRRTPEQSKLKQEDRGRLRDGKPTKTLGRIFSLPDFDSSSSKKSVPYEVFDASQSLKIPMTVDVCNICEPEVVDVFVDREESLELDTSLAEVIEKDAGGALLEGRGCQSPISDRELYSPEILRFSCIHSEETQLGIDALEAGAEDSELQAPSELDCYFDFFNVEVDLQNEDEFNYVRDILWKSGFGTDEFLRAWYSSNQPVDPLMSLEVECTSNAEMFFDHQLLFDLINEVLLEIYDNSSSCCPWLSRFDTHTRPMPSGHHVLEEVWANVSWCLNSQPQLDPTLDHAVARDFAKKDGWMHIQYDCEDLGLEVEDLILDDLLYDVVLDLYDVFL